MRYSIICATNSDEELYGSLLSSKNINDHELILMRGYKNICRAYNEGVKKATNKYLIFVHQDVFLCDNFFSDLDNAISTIKEFGVLGVAGKDFKGGKHGNIVDRGVEWGSKDNLPHPIMTLDEMLLVTDKNVLFDARLTSQHFFGTDICLQMIAKGRVNYAIDAKCHHNCYKLERLPADKLPKEFQDAKEYIRNKWCYYLPIHTTCTIIN